MDREEKCLIKMQYTANSNPLKLKADIVQKVLICRYTIPQLLEYFNTINLGKEKGFVFLII